MLEKVPDCGPGVGLGLEKLGRGAVLEEGRVVVMAMSTGTC